MRLLEREQDTLQDVSPELLLWITEWVSNWGSLGLPFNVQNLLGNWLQLIGQIILVFNAQQQYWQEGPGAYYMRCSKTAKNDSLCQKNIAEKTISAAQIDRLQYQIIQMQQKIELLEQKLSKI